MSLNLHIVSRENKGNKETRNDVILKIPSCYYTYNSTFRSESTILKKHASKNVEVTLSFKIYNTTFN